MALDLRSSNHLAIFLLILGKCFGIVGLVLGMVNRTAGGILLALDAVFIIAAIVIALRASRAQVREADADKAVIARLVREGALEQYLRDIEADAQNRDEEPTT